LALEKVRPVRRGHLVPVAGGIKPPSAREEDEERAGGVKEQSVLSSTPAGRKNLQNPAQQYIIYVAI